MTGKSPAPESAKRGGIVHRRLQISASRLLLLAGFLFAFMVKALPTPARTIISAMVAAPSQGLIEKSLLLRAQRIVERLQRGAGGLKLLQSCGEPFLDPCLAIKRCFVLIPVPITLKTGRAPLFCGIGLGLTPLGPGGLLLVGQIQFGFKIGEVSGFSRIALGAKVLMPCTRVFALILHRVVREDDRRAQKWNGQNGRDPVPYHDVSPILFMSYLIPAPGENVWANTINADREACTEASEKGP